jgi:hypothetical protein
VISRTTMMQRLAVMPLLLLRLALLLLAVMGGINTIERWRQHGHRRWVAGCHRSVAQIWVIVNLDQPRLTIDRGLLRLICHSTGTTTNATCCE